MAALRAALILRGNRNRQGNRGESVGPALASEQSKVPRWQRWLSLSGRPLLAPLRELLLQGNPCPPRQVRGLSASSQPAAGHGAKSVRKGADGIQKQPEGRRRAPRGCPGGTQDCPKGMPEAPRTAKKACSRHPRGKPGNELVPESSKAISTSALYPFGTPILAPFL